MSKSDEQTRAKHLLLKPGGIQWRPAVLGALALIIGTALPAKAATEKKQAQQSIKVEEMTITATKTGVDRESIPFDMYTVDRKEIERQPDPFITNIGELIRDVPGVNLGQVWPVGPPWIQLRGTGYFIGRTVYVVDGLPLVHPIISMTINPNDVEQMDVLLGPSSALYGPNASGGVVNVVTRGGVAGMGARASMSYGSFNTLRTNASMGDREDQWSYYLSYSRERSDGYKHLPVSVGRELWNLGKKQYLPPATLEDAAYEKNYLAGKIGWRNSRGASLTFSANYMNAYMEGGQPNNISDDHGNRIISSLVAELPLSSLATLRFRGGYQFFRRPARNTKGLSLDNEGNLILDSTPTNHSVLGPRVFIPLELQSDFYLGQNNILTMGVFYSNTQDESTKNDASTGALLTNSHWKIDNWAFYAQDQHFFFDRRLSLIAGVRHDTWRYYDIYDSGSTIREPSDVDKSYTTYRGGARFKVNDIVSLRTSAGTAFWPGAATWFFQNISTGNRWREANPDLEPEKTWMVDLGTDITYAKTGTALSLTAYYGKIEDMVSYRYDENPAVPGGSIIRTQNLGGAKIYGLEALLSQKLVEHLFFKASLTLNRSRIEDTGSNDGNQLRNAPDYHGSVGFQYLNPKVVKADLRLRFSDRRYYDDENTDLPYFKMGAYQSLDAKIWRDWRLSKNWVLTTSVSVVNLLDQDYEYELIYVAPGRYAQCMVGLRYVF